MRPDPRIRIFPSYFDEKLSRSQGRRLSKKQAISNPKLIELKIAAQKLEYVVEIDNDKIYPRQWVSDASSTKGLMYLSKEGELKPKTEIIRDLSKTITNYARPKILERQKEIQKDKGKLVKKKKTPQTEKRGKAKGHRSTRRRR